MLKKIKNFLKNTTGSILPIVGIMIIPLTITLGAAVDYSMYVNQKNEIQTALDAAGLAASKELPRILAQIPAGVTDDEQKVQIEALLTTYANSFLEANVDDAIDRTSFGLSVEFIKTQGASQGSIRLSTETNYDTVFGGVNGRDGGILLFEDVITDDLVTEITLGDRTVEVALVLDNSGSMRGGRIDTLRTATTELVNIVHDTGTLAAFPRPVQFSIVPFGGSVNVGDTYARRTFKDPNNDRAKDRYRDVDTRNARWMDTRGWAPNHHENFDWANTYRLRAGETGQLRNNGFRTRINGTNTWQTRFTLFDNLGEPWAGCVEMREYPHNVQDTVVDRRDRFRDIRDAHPTTPTNPHGGLAALFVPMFAPDEPDRRFPNDPDTEYGARTFDTGQYFNNYLDDFQDFNPNTGTSDALGLDNGIQYNNGDLITGLEARGAVNQVTRTNWMFKYQANQRQNNVGDAQAFSTDTDAGFGPNWTCTTDPIVPLTPDRQTVLDAVNGLDAGGFTNIQAGLVWGWRSISPAEPFPQGRENDDENNLKYIILLTDGNNTYIEDPGVTPNNSSYGAWGYARLDGILPNPNITETNNNDANETHSRWQHGLTNDDLENTIYAGTNINLAPTTRPQFEAIMNAHTAQACENIKNDGISIYTIAFEVPLQGGVRDLLEACAGSGRLITNPGTPEEIVANIVTTNNFTHDVSGAGLRDAFAEIAAEISATRITQ